MKPGNHQVRGENNRAAHSKQEGTSPDNKVWCAHEYKITRVRECPLGDQPICETSVEAAAYCRAHLRAHPYFNPDAESLFVILVNSRRRIKGHALVSVGLLDTVCCDAREVFRPAVMTASKAVIVVHNHPSGDPTPSDTDIAMARQLIRAGQVMNIDLLDSIVLGEATPKRPQDYASLRDLGYFNEEPTPHAQPAKAESASAANEPTTEKNGSFRLCDRLTDAAHQADALFYLMWHHFEHDEDGNAARGIVSTGLLKLTSHVTKELNACSEAVWKRSRASHHSAEKGGAR